MLLRLDWLREMLPRLGHGCDLHSPPVYAAMPSGLISRIVTPHRLVVKLTSKGLLR